MDLDLRSPGHGLQKSSMLSGTRDVLLQRVKHWTIARRLGLAEGMGRQLFSNTLTLTIHIIIKMTSVLAYRVGPLGQTHCRSLSFLNSHRPSQTSQTQTHKHSTQFFFAFFCNAKLKLLQLQHCSSVEQTCLSISIFKLYHFPTLYCSILCHVFYRTYTT